MGIFDFDNDGWKDVFAAAGDVQDNTENAFQRQVPAAEPADAERRPRRVSRGVRRARRAEPRSRVRRFRSRRARGRRGHPPQRTARSCSATSWARATTGSALKLIGARSNRDAIGARVTVRSGGVTQVNRVTTSTGYACSSELAVHFGLGRSTARGQYRNRMALGVAADADECRRRLVPDGARSEMSGAV